MIWNIETVKRLMFLARLRAIPALSTRDPDLLLALCTWMQIQK
jgi:hypothetical protein